MFRPVTPADTRTLLAMAEATGVFQPGEVDALLGGVLEELHAGRLGDGHTAWAWGDPSAGWVYFSPVPHADGVWNLWWIGVDPARQKAGIGGAMLADVEAHIREAGGRLLLIETSSAPAFDPVRRFYAARGYADCGTIPHFYGDGDGKVTYAKRMTP